MGVIELTDKITAFVVDDGFVASGAYPAQQLTNGDRLTRTGGAINHQVLNLKHVNKQAVPIEGKVGEFFLFLELSGDVFGLSKLKAANVVIFALLLTFFLKPVVDKHKQRR